MSLIGQIESLCVLLISCAIRALGGVQSWEHLYIPNIWITFANIGSLSALHASRALTDKLWPKVCNQQETLADATHSRHQGAKGGRNIHVVGEPTGPKGVSEELQLDEGAN